LARELFDVPMACLDIVGEDIAWLKSVQGFDGVEGIRKDSYCHHTVLSDGVCVVHNARTDPRVFDSAYANTWVAYAGVPLHFDKQRVGVLCIGDSKPRDFTNENLRKLLDLAIMAERELQIAALSETQVALAVNNKELEMKTLVDVLTHVWNRGAIMDVAETEFSHISSDSPLSVLMIKIDHFKTISEMYGQAAGEEVLRTFAERLRGAVRPSDAVGRYGDEEFIAILPGVEASNAKETSERIRSAVSSSPILFDTQLIEVACSMGCACQKFPLNDSFAKLIARANSALYQAKKSGRNPIEISI